MRVNKTANNEKKRMFVVRFLEIIDMARVITMKDIH